MVTMFMGYENGDPLWKLAVVTQFPNGSTWMVLPHIQYDRTPWPARRDFTWEILLDPSHRLQVPPIYSPSTNMKKQTPARAVNIPSLLLYRNTSTHWPSAPPCMQSRRHTVNQLSVQIYITQLCEATAQFHFYKIPPQLLHEKRVQ